MAKKSVGGLTAADLKGKKVFLRADLNVPLDENQHITDDTRVRAAIPTIKHLIGNAARVILSSHLGRPKGVTPKYSLKPLVPRLSELLGVRVEKAHDCIGPEVETMVAGLPEGGVLLLENVRFYEEEEKNEPGFAKKLDSLADLFVNDAFGTAQRAHASTEGVTKFLKPSVAENNLCLQKYQGAKLAKNSAMFLQGLPLFLTLPCFVSESFIATKHLYASHGLIEDTLGNDFALTGVY
ncbi:phosphoglycerate kinase, chloroplastic-like protein [Cinnamomum micranthum f. kanehirae]|uniref:Phosphoglycerate kinase n=1 Tax=Cinnamomum micranthum f. kanehirae TaxID=337451 RepID=A0A443PRK5_9MAGN|nr:phosphoglycerate kinase, chloroplastic-like protein [Cinnamomum micranthum f. kanehirae]